MRAAGKIATMMLIMLAGDIQAQDFMSTLFKQDLGKSKSTVNLNYLYTPAADVENQDADLSVTRYGLDATVPFSQSENHEWSLFAGNETLRLNTAAVLPDSGAKVPTQFYDPYLGVLYRRQLENQWIVGGITGISSASDKPFDSGNEYMVDFTAFLQQPIEDGTAWMFFLNYSTQRTFLRNVPLPGVAFYWRPNEQFMSVVGIPMAYILWRPVQVVSLQASYFPVHTIDTTLSYNFTAKTALYTGFYWKNDEFLRADRRDDDDWFFYDYQQVRLGLRHEFCDYFSVDTWAGYEFNRYLFEGDDFYDDRHDNRLDISDSPVFGINATMKF